MAARRTKRSTRSARAAGEPARKKSKASTPRRKNPRKQAPPPPDVNVNYQQERVQCGKRQCACNTDNKTLWHGPYWRGYWNDPETGKKRSFYVGKNFTPPRTAPRPGAYSERRAPPTDEEREHAREAPPHEHEPQARGGDREERHHHAPPPPPRAGSRFEQAAEVLGVSLSASQTDAKKAYRKAAMENHPDRFKGAEHARREALMKQINAAWDFYQKYRGWK